MGSHRDQGTIRQKKEHQAPSSKTALQLQWRILHLLFLLIVSGNFLAMLSGQYIEDSQSKMESRRSMDFFTSNTNNNTNTNNNNNNHNNALTSSQPLLHEKNKNENEMSSNTKIAHATKGKGTTSTSNISANTNTSTNTNTNTNQSRLSIRTTNKMLHESPPLLLGTKIRPSGATTTTTSHHAPPAAAAVNLRSSVDRIFYINSFANPNRRVVLEAWLQEQTLLQNVSIHRLEAVSGDTSTCHIFKQNQQQNPQRNWNELRYSNCIRRLRLFHSYQTLLRHSWYYNLLFSHDDDDDDSSITMIFHDDDGFLEPFFDWGRLEQALGDLPRNNWDVAKLDCDHGGGSSSSSSSRNNSEVHQQEFDHSNQNTAPSSLPTAKKDTECARSKVIIWRNKALLGLKQRKYSGGRPGFEGDLDLECLGPRAGKELESYCLNNIGTVTNQRVRMEEPNTIPVKLTWIVRPRVPIERLKEENLLHPVKDSYADSSHGNMDIERIYYSNLENNALRRQNMEQWLQPLQLQTNITYKRINATVGVATDQCVKEKNNGTKCIKISGLVRTLVGIIENENTTGLSLVLEDDFILEDPKLERIQETLKMVPNDWDIIRFDAWEKPGKIFSRKINKFVTNATDYKLTKECRRKRNGCQWWCGGTHSMLFRGSSVHKLRNMWSTLPYDDADCRLSQEGKNFGVKSYLINIGIGDFHIIEERI